MSFIGRLDLIDFIVIRILLFLSDSNPVVIASPPHLAGMTLEERLLTYDWPKQFQTFQQVTQKGSFKVHCVGATDSVIQVS